MPRTLGNLIKQANTLSNRIPPRQFRLFATIVTPVKQIPLVIPTGYSCLAAFAVNFTDDHQIAGQIQPGVYQEDVLPYKDNLIIEVIERQGMQQTMKRFRATPIADSDPNVIGSNTSTANLKALDHNNIVSVTFQLIELGYDYLKNIMLSDVLLMTKLDTALLDQYALHGSKMEFEEPDNWKGVNIVKPIDNDRFFKQIVIKSGVPLTHLGRYLQNHDEFGIYNTGLGSYYRKGYWNIYPLFRMGRYNSSKRVLNVFRLPENAFPTVEFSYLDDGRVITVLSSGGGKLIDGRDIHKQNEGTGKRVVSPDAVMGETGYYYSKGQAILTREDAITEFKTSERSNENEIVPFAEKPTNNLAKMLSENAFNEGIEVGIEWHNSNAALIDPCMPVRYYYMKGEDVLAYREGVVLGLRYDYKKDMENTKPYFREFTLLELFLSHEEVIE